MNTFNSPAHARAWVRRHLEYEILPDGACRIVRWRGDVRWYLGADHVRVMHEACRVLRAAGYPIT